MINKDWHHNHKLGVNAPFDVRLAWHVEHEKHCNCRQMPAWMRKKREAQNGESHE